MSSRSRFDNFIASRNINPARGRGFRAYLHSNTGRQEFGLDPISAASDSPGRETNSSALVNRPFVASSGSNTSCITNYFTLTTSSCDDDLGTFTRTPSILSSPIMSVVIPSAVTSSRAMFPTMQVKNSPTLQSETFVTTQSRINTPLSPKTSQSSNFLSETPSTFNLQTPRVSSNSGNTRAHQRTEDTRSRLRASGRIDLRCTLQCPGYHWCRIKTFTFGNCNEPSGCDCHKFAWENKKVYRNNQS